MKGLMLRALIAIKLFSLITNGSRIPVELKRLFLRTLFVPVNIYRDELFLLLNQRKIDGYYDFFGIKVCFQDVPNLRRIMTGSFMNILYPYLFGPGKFNPDTDIPGLKALILHYSMS